MFGFNRTLELEPDRVEAGRRVRISGRIENPLLPGRYSVACLVSRNRLPVRVRTAGSEQHRGSALVGHDSVVRVPIIVGTAGRSEDVA